ncbi:MAG: NAD-dependent epimerase/dehydratase family protein [Thermoleophilia bacterium]|nr:NAD-dependent epimerase/dehydratase family protein [Thermoleophilia bacterium]
MRVVVIGATGNCGTALLRALELEPSVTSVVGVARRLPEHWTPGKVTWRAADVATDDLRPIVEGADVVVHLAWLIQPSHDRDVLERVNVQGSARVFDAAAAGDVPTLVYASSVGAYSAAPLDGELRGEGWPTDGIAPNDYSLQKARVERLLDGLELRRPEMRVVRLRPALVFQRDAATGIRRLFAGPLLPRFALRGGRLPVAPDVRGLMTQCVHADDLADAYRRAIVDPAARGAYNVATGPIIDAESIRAALGASRSVTIAPRILRRAADLAWRAHVEPIPGDWLDMGMRSPLLDTTRIRSELGWRPTRDAVSTLRELLVGMGDGAGFPTPPLDPGTSGPARVREFLTGIGERDR